VRMCMHVYMCTYMCTLGVTDERANMCVCVLGGNRIPGATKKEKRRSGEVA